MFLDPPVLSRNGFNTLNALQDLFFPIQVLWRRSARVWTSLAPLRYASENSWSFLGAKEGDMEKVPPSRRLIPTIVLP